MSFYRPNDDLVKRMKLALVTRWSTSPDLDLRMSPKPSQGSPAKSGCSMEWPVIGGAFLPRDKAEALDEEELHKEIRKIEPLLSDCRSSGKKPE